MTPKGSRPVRKAGWWAAMPTQLPNSSTLSRCSSATPSAVNRHSKPSTSACNPLLLASWLSSDESSCQHAPRLVAFAALLTQTAVEALRTLFLEDGLARPLGKERQTGGLVDRAGRARVVFDIDGTREAARQRALPKTPELPAPKPRLSEVCAPGYTGRKRGEVVRTRTTISQAHTSESARPVRQPGPRKVSGRTAPCGDCHPALQQGP